MRRHDPYQAPIEIEFRLSLTTRDTYPAGIPIAARPRSMLSEVLRPPLATVSVAAGGRSANNDRGGRTDVSRWQNRIDHGWSPEYIKFSRLKTSFPLEIWSTTRYPSNQPSSVP
jgi:hypothetical protein